MGPTGSLVDLAHSLISFTVIFISNIFINFNLIIPKIKSMYFFIYKLVKLSNAFVAQLGERKTEDLKVRGSIPRGGIFL